MAGFDSRLGQLEKQLPKLELQLGHYLGATTGAKEAVTAQARQLSCVEERLSSQLDAVQASVQVYQSKVGALEDELENGMNTLKSLAKHQALLTKLAASEEEGPLPNLSGHDAQMQELVLDLASRMSQLEHVDRPGRTNTLESAPPAEDSQLRPQLQQLQATNQRLHKEMLDVVAKLEEHSVHLASCRSRMEVLEAQNARPAVK